MKPSVTYKDWYEGLVNKPGDAYTTGELAWAYKEAERVELEHKLSALREGGPNECDCCGYDGTDLPRYRGMMQDVLDNLVKRCTAGLEADILSLGRYSKRLEENNKKLSLKYISAVGQAQEALEQLAALRAVLKTARCPNTGCCQGSIPHQVGDNKWEAEQCQFCYERAALLKQEVEGE